MTAGFEETMRYKEFAKTGFKTSLVGMGTYYDPLWIAQAMILGVQRGKEKKLDALKAGLEGGINFIDTAEIYRSESIVAEAIKERKRDELFVATKVFRTHLHEDALIKSCKRSLSKLGTSYIDLYQVHMPNSRVPIKETMGAMEKLLNDGLIRAIGISNFSMKQMQDAEAALKKAEISSTQMSYSLAHREIEKGILPHCEKENIAVIAYFPLGHGKLAGEFKGYSDVTSNVESKKWIPSQVALSWLFSKKVVFPIPRASKRNHVQLDAQAADLQLTPYLMQILERFNPA
jgi:diketogulonate reductase-like aldo/keto reductase